MLRILFASLPASALAADAAPLPDASGLWRSVLALAIVLAAILGVGLLMRRLAPLRAAGAPLRIVASQSLGARERVVVLEVSDQWLVVGVAPGGVRALATLPRGESPAAEPPPGHPFATLLARARGNARSAGSS